ncbi:MAG TPA: ATP-binding protein [Burkholderiaceae bacterium]|nr:ATP-binding protein [Burkholderiaceae bacterium]
MDSERTPCRAAGALATAGGVLLAGAAYAAGASHGQPRLLAACALAAAVSIALLWRGFAIRPAPAPAPMETAAAGLAPHIGAQLAGRAVMLESQLEFAPIALFRVHPDAGGIGVSPLNVSARRLLAPGRALDGAAVRHLIARQVQGQRRVLEIETARGSERMLATAAALTVAGAQERLVALMPMEDELEAEAMQAWQKLVRVLAHEIMNSLTPVASLAHTARGLLAGASQPASLAGAHGDGLAGEHAVELPAELAGELDTALDAIGRRADGLTSFVSGYRALASVPEAQRQRIAVRALFARLSALITPAWEARGGQAHWLAEPASLELMADAGQLEQALVNLLTNAAEATAGCPAPAVHITASLSRGGRLRIEVRDNGPGVPDDIVADIFTPFFSTRREGDGIGLAMVRQLIHRNGGSVRYAKSVAPGARFLITF